MSGFRYVLGSAVLAMVAAAAIAAPFGCSASGDTGTSIGGSSASSTGSSSGHGGTGGGIIGNGGMGGGLGSSSSGVGGGCAETSSEAQEGFAPADIIIAVDTSGSMDLEAQWTQNNMNAMATIIINSGIDAHVVMISSTDICVPATLGSGNCPNDENLPGYRHVQQGVSSNNALQLILSTYPQWKDSLRQAASKTFVVVSDDESDMSATDFTNQMVALDPTFQGFKFDAIVSSAPPYLPGPCFLISAAEGQVYEQLVAQTGGVLGDLCLQDFTPVFQDIATSVVQDSKIDCVYDIPDPGNGDTIDFTKVNVEFKPDPNAPGQVIPFIPGGQNDCDASGGWYYDDPVNPTQIIFCDATCTAVQGQTQGSVSVIFGCATVVK